jgi:hypothetical protein
VRIARTGAALVKRHDSADLQAGAPRKRHELQVPSPIVNPRLVLLHQAPPDIHHHALDAGRRERPERLRHSPAPTDLPGGVHGVDWERDEHWRSTPPALRGQPVEELVLVEFAAVVRRDGASGAGGRGRVEPGRNGESAS